MSGVFSVISVYLFIAVAGMFLAVMARERSGGKWDQSIKRDGETGIETLFSVFIKPLVWPLVIIIFVYQQRHNVYEWLTEPK